jgi:CBS domain containing-hemolysin-like protein
MALVVDEHGVFVGLVTMEDLVEVIVGEIRDEHKAPKELVLRVADGVVEADGSIPVHELNGDHGLKLPESSSYVTVAGLVLDRLGAIPQEGDVVDVPPYTITVIGLEGRRISRLRIALATADVTSS